MRGVLSFWNDIYSKDAWKSLIPRDWAGTVGAEETRRKAAGPWYSLWRWDAVTQRWSTWGSRVMGCKFQCPVGSGALCPQYRTVLLKDH